MYICRVIKLNNMTKIKQLTNVLALCTIVGLSCWVGYLLAENERIAFENSLLKDVDSVNVANDSIHKLDSITISKMPPVEYLDFLKQLNP
jgi:hypothetical protein